LAKSKKGGLKIRTVKNKEDRKRPSVFLRLKAEEGKDVFKGIALFEPDPELEGNPGYYEYYDHYDKQGNTYVPCAGENCPFCSANDNPSTRALTVWYFSDNDVKDQIKVFTANYSTINDLTDESEEEGGLLGKKIRIKRLDDRGNYKVRVLSDKPLTKKEIKDLLKRLEELFKDGLEGLVLTQLKKQIERLKAVDALDDDDEDDDDDDEDEDDEPKSKAKKGKAKDDDEEDDEDEEEEDDDEDEAETPDAIEDVEFEILKASKAKNTITVEHDDEEITLVGDDDVSVEGFKKGQTVVVSAEYDDEEEQWTLTSIAEPGGDEEEEEEEDDDEDDNSESIEGVVYEVVKVQEKDEIFDLKNDDGKTKMWLGEGVDVDYDEIKKGVEVTVSAQQDEEGDWIITEIEVAKKKTGKGGKKKK
jgi:hypothetical protein